MKSTGTILFTMFTAICSASFGQVSQTPPQKWTSEAPLTAGSGLHKLKLAYNTPELIRQELLDTNTVRLVARFAGLTDKELSTIQIAPGSFKDWVNIYQLGQNDRAFSVLGEQLRNYVEAREEGHSREFLMEVLTNRVAPASLSNPDLRVMATNLPFVPPLRLTKAGSGTVTNQAGVLLGSSTTTTITVINGKTVTNVTTTTSIPKADEVCRWTSYTVTDGDIGWCYYVRFKADGSLDFIRDEKCDSKELDPKYHDVIKEVEAEVEAEMKKAGTYHKLGSVHNYWHSKKEKLKARGIEWRSPAELNPNTIYD